MSDADFWTGIILIIMTLPGIWAMFGVMSYVQTWWIERYERRRNEARAEAVNQRRDRAMRGAMRTVSRAIDREIGVSLNDVPVFDTSHLVPMSEIGKRLDDYIEETEEIQSGLQY